MHFWIFISGKNIYVFELKYGGLPRPPVNCHRMVCDNVNMFGCCKYFRQSLRVYAVWNPRAAWTTKLEANEKVSYILFVCKNLSLLNFRVWFFGGSKTLWMTFSYHVFSSLKSDRALTYFYKCISFIPPITTPIYLRTLRLRRFVGGLHFRDLCPPRDNTCWGIFYVNRQ